MQIITHMMIMQLKYPTHAYTFYKHIFGFIAFNLVPIENVSSTLFDFEDQAYSTEAD